MRRYFYILFLFFIILSGCELQEVQSLWPPTEVIVDGQPYDWKQEAYVKLMNDNLGLGIQNDTENLYLIFAFRSRIWAERMQRSGVYIWLNETIEDKGGMGIRYIGRMHITEIRDENEEDEGLTAINPPGREHEIIISLEDRLFAINRKEGFYGRIMPDGSSGPAASFSPPTILNPSYIYEFKIPLKECDVYPKGLGFRPGDYVYLSIEWGGLDEIARERIRKLLEMGYNPSMIKIPPVSSVSVKVKLAEKEEAVESAE